jgi:putative hydrolase of the HAD superfamily
MTSDVIEEARWRWIVGQVFPDVGDPESCFRELWDHFARPSSWRCFDDVAEVFAQLAGAGFRLAIASNFDVRLHSVCDSLVPSGSVEHRIVSATVGFRKPSPGFYDAVLQACGCQPNRIVMIGDNLECDVLGPRAAGMNALHLDRSRLTGDDSRLASLTELVDWLQRRA